ncbi:MAG TPA: restriction endonuclease subunit S, partial [Victivallales bacterium]|nr:restriction endonuclease subunit S [Victivallales bacterium]
MKWEKGILFDLCDINPENIQRNYPYEYIQYFDITSVGSGVVTINDEIPLNSAPSRAKRIVRSNDTILATVRPGNRSFYYFKTAFENSIASTGFAVLRPKAEKTDPRFLYYLVTEPRFTAYLIAHEQGANYPAVTPNIIGSKPIEYPPLPTQRKIASILSAYDDLIENNLKRIKLLEEMAQLHYKIDFGEFQFGDKEPQNLPKGWSVKSIGEIYGKLESGSRPKGGIDKELKEGIASVGAENVIGLGKYNYQSEKLIPEAFFENMKRGIIENKDILIYKDGAYIGKTTLFQDGFPHEKCCVN